MPKKPTIYSTQQFNQFDAKLDELIATPKGYELRELVNQCKGKIKAALDNGYTHDDVVEVLVDLGVSIKVSTLLQYLRDEPKPKDEPSSPEEKADESESPPNDAPNSSNPPRSSKEKATLPPESKNKTELAY